MSDVKTQEPQLHKHETEKRESNGLEGTVRQVLESEATHFEKADVGVMKHHGTYQQDNRDVRRERRKQKLDKDWIFMVRAKIPGGRIAPDQFLAHSEIAQKWSYGSLRVTSRQGIQLHGVKKENLKNVIKGINDIRLTTQGACGDVNRNTMACPVCDLDWRASLGFERLAFRIADHFAPRSTAYWEIWCDGEKWGEKIEPTREEPIYGKTYLPRKFKMGVAVPEDNCIDIYTQDLGIEVVHDRDRILGYDLIVGGGMGFTFSKPETYPRLGTRLIRVPAAEDILKVVETVVLIQRDHGGRVNRAHARLKYLLDDRGVDWFKEELFRRVGKEFPEAGPQPEYVIQDHLGWNETNDGKLMLGVPIANGRIEDTEDLKLMTGLREVVSRFRPMVRTTPLQDIVLAGLEPNDRNAVETILRDHGIRLIEELTPLRRRAMACPALPTCGLALADSERSIPGILARLEELGSAHEQIEFRMTGCPNSCVRTPTAEIGIAGQAPGKYAMVLGGSPQGTRLAWQLGERLPEDRLPDLIHSLIQSWRQESQNGESFGDWSHRLGRDAVIERLPEEQRALVQ